MASWWRVVTCGGVYVCQGLEIKALLGKFKWMAIGGVVIVMEVSSLMKVVFELWSDDEGGAWWWLVFFHGTSVLVYYCYQCHSLAIIT